MPCPTLRSDFFLQPDLFKLSMRSLATATPNIATMYIQWEETIAARPRTVTHGHYILPSPPLTLYRPPPFLVENPVKRQEKGDTSLCGRQPACMCSSSWFVQMANKMLSICGAMPKKANIIATSLVAFVIAAVVALFVLSPTSRLQIAHSSAAATAVTVASKPQTVYAHVHVMRTGGSKLNHVMASQFDNVCGNKGYSLDYYQARQAKKRDLEPRLTHSKPEVMDEIGTARPLSSLAAPIHLV